MLFVENSIHSGLQQVLTASDPLIPAVTTRICPSKSDFLAASTNPKAFFA